MIINENTKLIGRFHKEASPRGLNIYNPFFEEAGLNALYFLFYNPDPKVLINGFRSLNLAGAITAGFESDEVLPTLLDEVDETSRFVGRVGYLTNTDGRVVGHTQSGQGMLRTIKHIINPEDEKIVIVGAGNVAKGLLFEIEKEKINCEVSIFNRTIEKAQKLKKRFEYIKTIDSLDHIKDAKGDLLINLTSIGGKVKDFTFPKSLVQKFSGIVDVTFETEKTELVKTAKALNKKVATGWDMFTYQAQVCIEGILGVKADYKKLKKHVVAGLSATVS